MRKKLLVLALFITLTGGYNKEVKATSWGMTTELRAFVEKLSPPKFIKELEDITVIEGDRAVLRAEFSGNPVPTIEVSKDGAPLKKLKKIKVETENFTVTITIEDVGWEDAGQYTIKATNKLGTATTTCKLTVVEAV